MQILIVKIEVTCHYEPWKIINEHFMFSQVVNDYGKMGNKVALAAVWTGARLPYPDWADDKWCKGEPNNFLGLEKCMSSNLLVWNIDRND